MLTEKRQWFLSFIPNRCDHMGVTHGMSGFVYFRGYPKSLIKFLPLFEASSIFVTLG